MKCGHAQEIISAQIDGEASPAELKALGEHLAGCPNCAAHAREFEALAMDLRTVMVRPPVPPGLEARVHAAIADGDARPHGRARREWMSLAAATLVGVVLSGSAFGLLQIYANPLDRTLDAAIDAHVRGLNVGPLIQVASSNRHVVKPWFDGKLALAPFVPDLAQAGFPLVGGRIDYIRRHPAAAIVYGSRAHTITLFALEDDGLPAGEWRDLRAGYSAEGWRSDGLAFVAVSDVAPGDLDAFAAAFRAAAR